jgi:hypothetical protein
MNQKYELMANKCVLMVLGARENHKLKSTLGYIYIFFTKNLNNVLVRILDHLS